MCYLRYCNSLYSGAQYKHAYELPAPSRRYNRQVHGQAAQAGVPRAGRRQAARLQRAVHTGVLHTLRVPRRAVVQGRAPA